MQKGLLYIILIHLTNFLTSQCTCISYPHQKACSFPEGLDPWIVPGTEEWIIKNQSRVTAPLENEKKTSQPQEKKNTSILFFLKCNYSDSHDGKPMV